MSKTFEPDKGMPLSIFQNKYAIKDEDGNYSSWKDRLTDVMKGNWELHYVDGSPEYNITDGVYSEAMPGPNNDTEKDIKRSIELAQNGIIAMAGRHLQHGGPDQYSNKNGESFTNCSTAMCSFIKFWLLMKGSGVGRAYDSDVIRVDWDYCPNIRVVLNKAHADFNENHMESLNEASEKYPSHQDNYRWFEVEDSAEGWAKVVEIIETAAYQKTHKNKLFVFDFSEVRAKGTPIKGQQGRPSSGPAPFMQAIQRIATLKGSGMPAWKQSMWVDHYLADTVALGGIRRSARIATKWWKDSDIFDFINIKRSGELFTANNSVSVCNEFWDQCTDPRTHAYRVFNAILGAQYMDNTGEPGFVNVENMKWDNTGAQYITPKTLLSERLRKRMKIHPKTMSMLGDILDIIKKKPFPFLPNPCGEIILAMWGGYCVIGEVNLSRVDSIDEASEAIRLLTQALIRTNRMKFLYDGEVKRTNRIGVGVTGLHEFGYKFYGGSVKDFIADGDHEFWRALRTLRDVALSEAQAYSKFLGLKTPHTVGTMKPSGTISKVLNVTESAHPTPYGTFLRWVQFQEDSPDLADLRRRGYPVKDVRSQYKQTYVVGFPTKQPIVDLAGDNLVLAGELSLVEHYTWIALLEKNFLGDKGNQVSYTVKYNPSKVSWEHYKSVTLQYLRTVRCCSVMPQIDMDESKYAYIPEQRITLEEYNSYMAQIDRIDKEHYDDNNLVCEGGACPIELDRNE